MSQGRGFGGSPTASTQFSAGMALECCFPSMCSRCAERGYTFCVDVQARTEAEHMRQECHNLEGQLERTQAQLRELQVSLEHRFHYVDQQQNQQEQRVSPQCVDL